MKEGYRNLLVGLFMVGGLGALGVLLMMFGEAPSWLGGAEYSLSICVDEIAGIDDGTPVYMNGIKIGRVTTLDFINKSAPDKGVKVICSIEKQFTVPRGASAECVGPALGLGRGRIEIFAKGSGMPPVEPGGTIRGKTVNALEKIFPETMASSLESTVIKIGDFAETLTPVAKDLHGLFKKTPLDQADATEAAGKSSIANLYTAVQRLDRALKHFDEIIGDPDIGDGLRETIANVRAMSVDGRDAFANLRDTTTQLKADSSRIADKLEFAVDNINSRANQIADASMPVLDNAARTTANLNLITGNLVEGKGTLGLLLNDSRLYEVMVLSVERIKDLVDSLRRLAYRFEKKGRIGLDVGGFPTSKKIPQ